MAQENTTLIVATPDTVKQALDIPVSVPETHDKISTKVEETVSMLLAIGERDLSQQRDMTNLMTSLGEDSCRQLAQCSQLLKTPLHRLVDDAQDGGGTAKSLLDLQQQVNAVNPNRTDFTMGTIRRLLSFLPFVGTPIAKWFSRYQTAEGVIKDIVQSLRGGQAQLQRDNITLEADQIRYRELTFLLEDYVRFGQLLDEKVNQTIETAQNTETKVKFLQEQVLFPLRQRVMDLQQTLAVNQQAVITTEVIMQNNRELIRGVDRAINVTVSALETASVMSIALQHQKKLLDATQAVNDTTNDLILQTSEQLRDQGVSIQKQASESQLDISKLKQAFSNINAALNDISQYRVKALPQMAQSIVEMDQLTEQMESRIKDAEKGKDIQQNLSQLIEL
ncbi:toxic anion resistance protein [Photobacterium angustum]|uniref:Toxic anion resistance protein n=1 Tax=Photobacterium angustum TaxID=661 RepID=A0A855SI87_PHOAN|nr:toxic anion resistance protein [Photobacterium angustum]KJF82218.1 toxic anion resistance family protein [Photobacterium damselae subsp. damselae]KJG32592.1 toxic anion resistance family protein [Photobacterium angustum]KJG41281.1 toxic anion resistance family protein [Photobacterium angustum]KJG46128.1 toxic anion resistance family protein [Photobacterium angustum]KJG49045.1 toxic anion resistance family protein [Photobacterium angustum]